MGNDRFSVKRLMGIWNFRAKLVFSVWILVAYKLLQLQKIISSL